MMELFNIMGSGMLTPAVTCWQSSRLIFGLREQNKKPFHDW